MKLKILIYLVFIVFALNSCATYNQKRFEKYTEKTNLIIINDIQDIYMEDYENEIENVDSIFSVDELKELEVTDLLNEYYEKNNNNKKQDNMACLKINKEIDKFYYFIEKIKYKIDSHIKNQIAINSTKYSSYSFDYINIPNKIKRNIYDSLDILNDKKNSIRQAGYNYEEKVYNKKLQENKKYQNNKKQIETKQNKIEKLSKDIVNIINPFYKYDPYYMPSNIKNQILSTDDMIVLQVIPNGILAVQNIPRQFQYGFSDFYGTWNQVMYGHRGAEYPAIFIKTKKSFIVGQTIKQNIKYSGKNFTYPTTYGTATVMVFNIVNDFSKKKEQCRILEKEIENLKEQQNEIENSIKKDFYFYK